MADEITELYDQLRKEITAEKLRDITSEIINAYKNKHNSVINDYASRLGIPLAQTSLSKVFNVLIQTFHPDKIIKIHNDLDNFLHNQDLVNLKRYKNIYIIIYHAISYKIQ